MMAVVKDRPKLLPFGRRLQDRERYGYDFSTEFQVESYGLCRFLLEHSLGRAFLPLGRLRVHPLGVAVGEPDILAAQVARRPVRLAVLGINAALPAVAALVRPLELIVQRLARGLRKLFRARALAPGAHQRHVHAFEVRVAVVALAQTMDQVQVSRERVHVVEVGDAEQAGLGVARLQLHEGHALVVDRGHGDLEQALVERQVARGDLIALASFLPQGMLTVMLVLTFTGWAWPARAPG